MLSDGGPGTDIAALMQERERISHAFLDTMDRVPRVFHAAIWRHIARTGGKEEFGEFPPELSEMAELVEIEDHATAWDGSPAPHVTLRVNLVSVTLEDLDAFLRQLRGLLGLPTKRGTKAEQAYRSFLAARAMARRVEGNDRPSWVPEARWDDYRASWRAYHRRGHVDSYVLRTVCDLYSNELGSGESISESTVGAALRARWKSHGQHARSLADLFGIDLSIPGHALGEGQLPPEPWVKSTIENIYQPWW